jgi:dipeptidyl aminopeptidase/acylaminoacyl peptidase
VTGIDLSPDGATLAFVTNEDGASSLHLLDTKDGKEKNAPKIPLGVFGGVKWHENGRDLGFTLSSARSSADAFSVDVETGKLERWTESETGGLDPDEFAEAERIEWKSFDGRSITGLLYRPPKKFSGPRPVVIDIHGGPEGQTRPTFRGSTNYWLNELGVALIYPNIRGSSGYGKTYLQLDNGFKREDSYKDIEALLDWIGKQEHLDAGRIMVTGGSYGGHMTLAVATNYSDRIRCAVDVVGISNLRTFLENTQGYRQDLRRVEYGDEREPEMRAFLDRIAPLNNASKIRKPLFVIQGANDPRVPKSESDQIVETLKRSGTPVWYLVAKDEGHGFRKKPNVDFQIQAVAAFMKEFLLN